MDTTEKVAFVRADYTEYQLETYMGIKAEIAVGKDHERVETKRFLSTDPRDDVRQAQRWAAERTETVFTMSSVDNLLSDFKRGF